MDLPQTLHGQLYLLSYDQHRRDFDRDHLKLFGLALRAAMLTDLHLTGHLADEGDKPYPRDVAPPDDPLLRVALNRIGAGGAMDWAQFIAHNQKRARGDVRDQLVADGWLIAQGRRMLGIGSARLQLYDEDRVSALADRVAQAVRNAIAGAPAEPRPLAVGLLGVLGQMPTVFSFSEAARHREELRELTSCAIGPIVGLHHAILTYYETVRADASWF